MADAQSTGERTATLRIPGYEDLRLISRGTAGEIYRAIQDRLDRPVAVKVLQLDASTTRADVAQELATMVQLSQHPYIVSVIDTGLLPDGRPYLVTDYCEEGSYREILAQRGQLPVSEAVDVAIKVAEALQAAHDAGIVHRDVKPGNILRSRFGPALTDFGIASRPAELSGSDTLHKVTLHHAAPEALRREFQSPQSDVYSLGSTLWHLLVGYPPFAKPGDLDPDPFEYRERVLRNPAPLVPRADVPTWLQTEIARAMIKNPAGRHPTAWAFAEALRRGWAQWTGHLWMSPSGQPGAPPAQPPDSSVDAASSQQTMKLPAAQPPRPPAQPPAPAAATDPPPPTVPRPTVPPPATPLPVQPPPAQPPVQPPPARPAAAQPAAIAPETAELPVVAPAPTKAAPPPPGPPRAEPPPLPPEPAPQPSADAPVPVAAPVPAAAAPVPSAAPAAAAGQTTLAWPPPRRPMSPAGTQTTEAPQNLAPAPAPPAPVAAPGPVAPQPAPAPARRPPGTEQPVWPRPTSPAHPGPGPVAHPAFPAAEAMGWAAPSGSLPSSAPPVSVPPGTRPPGAPHSAPPSSAPPFSAPPANMQPASGPPGIAPAPHAMPGRPDQPPARILPSSAPPGSPPPSSAPPASAPPASGPPSQFRPGRPGGRSGLRAVLVAAVAGVLLGTIAVIGFKLLTDDPAPQTRPTTPSSPLITGNVNPEISPTDVKLEDRGSEVTVSWTDRTGGHALYYVAGGPQAAPAQILTRGERGITSAKVEDLDPKSNYCFVVVAVLSSDEFGTSSPVCTSRV